MKITLCAAACILFVCVGWLLCRSQQTLDGAAKRSVDHNAVDRPVASAALSFGRDTETGKSSDPSGGNGIVSTADFRQVVMFTVGACDVVLRNEERVIPAVSIPSADPFDAIDYEYRASYRVFGVCGRQAYELYLIGLSDTGDCVVEQWKHVVLTGAYYFDRSPSLTPVGVPVSGVPAIATGIKGGVYVPAALRQRPGRQQRIELLRSASLGAPHAIACDPEGRFLLLVCGNAVRTLYRLDLSDGALPVPLLNSGSVPHLAYCDSIHAEHHQTYGRVYLAGCSMCPIEGSESVTLLFDGENDGLFDAPLTLSQGDYAAAGFWGPVWVTNFLRH